MKKLAILFALALAIPVAGCGDDDTEAGSGGGGDALDTAAKISAFFDGKTLLMEGADIPSHPNGYSEDVNFGAATQCYNSTEISIESGTWSVSSDLGTLTGAPMANDVGDCDRDTVLTTVSFTSTNVLVENVEGDAECFDVTVTYPGFAQEGRASISADRGTVEMELFFAGQATGHRCADGAVGAQTVTLLMTPFTGDAVQTYRVQ